MPSPDDALQSQDALPAEESADAVSLGPLVAVAAFLVAQVVVFQFLLDAMLAEDPRWVFVYDGILLALATGSFLVYRRAERKAKA